MCRNVKYIRELLFDVEDMDNLFKMEKVEDFFVTAEIVKGSQFSH